MTTIAIAQINATVGVLSGNAEKICRLATHARQQGASLLITPELALCGYPPEDLLLRQDFNRACYDTLQSLAKRNTQIALLVGHPHIDHGVCFNAASLLQDGRVIATYHKHALPNHTVFDEVRYFEKGSQALVIEHQGVKLGVLICADVWESAPALQSKKAGAELLVALNASPFHVNKQSERHKIIKARIEETGLPAIYVNLVGGQDELVFDGASFVMNSQAELTQQLSSHQEQLALVHLVDGQPQKAECVTPLAEDASIYETLCLGLADYVNKNRFPGIVLGLSGGIDSALTLAIAVDALGKDRVHAVMMPSRFTANMSVEDAHQMATQLGVKFSQFEIEPLFQLYTDTLASEFAGLANDATEENLQARIRGMLLMALSNKYGTLLLTTGNKSEVAVGYCTLYGDMAGGFSVLKDIPKTMVYRLSEYRNQQSQVIPVRIIDRAPSAELRSNQTDQDSLPPYEILDGIMQAYVEDDASCAEILAMGYRQQDVARVVGLIDRNEYKRRQSPPGVRITPRGFGKDRRYPITNKFPLSLST